MSDSLQSTLTLISGNVVDRLLRDRDAEVLDAVREAYVAHGRGDSSLPHSTFLRFPGDTSNRIIGLPAYLGGREGRIAGMKWIASFPGNRARGMDRASAVLILNSMETGRAEAILESSIVSAKRTASSAALAASVMHGDPSPRQAGLIGCGPIHFETARFLQCVFPTLESFMLYDLDATHAEEFATQLARRFPQLGPSVVAQSPDALLESCALVSIATTAAEPWLEAPSLARCPAGTTVLQISLRDLSAEAILDCDNVVDDVDHVCRAQTSLHLAEQRVGNRDFIRAPLAELLEGRSAPRGVGKRVAVFSPFGLGILDLAVGRLALRRALAEGAGVTIPDFLPPRWNAAES